MKRALACVIVCVFTGHLSTVRAEPPERNGTPTPVAFAKYLGQVIDSLAKAHVTIKQTNNAMQRSSIVDKMTAVQNAGIELGIEKRSLKEFTSAENENVRVSAQGIIGAYEMMQRSLAILLVLYEKVDAAKTEDDLVGLRRQISDAKVLYQQGSAALVEATILAFASGIVPDQKDPENHAALSMAAQEKKQLIKSLGIHFGVSLKNKREDDTGPLKAGQALMELLEQEWAYAN